MYSTDPLTEMILESTDKLNWKKLLQVLAVPLLFGSGWYVRGQFNIHRAQPHYENRILELTETFDQKQYSRSYEEAYRSSRWSSWNDEFRMVHFYMHRADYDRCDVPRAVETAVANSSGIPDSIKQETAAHLLDTFERGDSVYDLYSTRFNRGRLAFGKSPVINTGVFTDQKAEVDHIIPAVVVPQLGLMPINLQWLPSSVNGRKSAEPTDEALVLLEYLFEKKIFSRDRLRKNLAAMKNRDLARSWEKAVFQSVSD